MTVPFFTKQNYLPQVVLDLDDFADTERNGYECLETLKELKEKYPKFKVTLFSIPFYKDRDNTKYFKEVLNEHGDWIELAIHGWHHRTPTECARWTFEEAEEKIFNALSTGVFVKVFKAPGWQISRKTYEVLNKYDFIVGDHTVSQYTEPNVLNYDRRPDSLKAYTVEHPWMVHGHTWDVENDNPAYRNGIKQILDEHEQVWDEKTEFYFITELFQKSDEIIDPTPTY